MMIFPSAQLVAHDPHPAFFHFQAAYRCGHNQREIGAFPSL
jgi:hypothetical protein